MRRPFPPSPRGYVPATPLSGFNLQFKEHVLLPTENTPELESGIDTSVKS